MKRKTLVTILCSFAATMLLVIAAAAFLLLPTSDYVETPGEADNIRNFMTVDGQRDQTKGSFRLVSVYLSPANRLDWLISRVNDTYSITPREEIQGGVSNRVYAMISEYQMKTAILSAEQVAFKAAGMADQLHTTYRGIYVASIAKNSRFAKKIRIGDTITKIDGRHFNNASGYQKYLANMSKGRMIELTVLRQGKILTYTGKTVHLANTKDKDYPKGRSGIGISLVDNVDVMTQPAVAVNVGQISGPSGGLMFSLQLYSQLTSENIKKGRNISGTGTIDDQGRIGEIGGIDKKIVAAQRAGSTVFFAPYVKPSKALAKLTGGPTNWQVAQKAQKKHAPKMVLVPVRNFQDALNYLKDGTIIKTK
ncbi:MAG: SepM family pheromone-processing serine protease [Oenococcus sp.]|uniref:SepM family pheromone-processing serine protease n=1 Tax=Oenococcus sp. TaxID=1979414 RepID=UPI0039E8ABDF